MMRQFFLFLALSLCGSVCLAQNDTAKTQQQPQTPVVRQVAIPGVDTPTSGGGLTSQTPQNPVVTSPNEKRKTQPPSDPRSFGVAVPIGKAKKDTLRKEK